MEIVYTLTAYPPSIGGAQLLAHNLAKVLNTRHTVRVITQWSERRTDWLLGTTLRAPLAESYSVDGIPVQRLSLPPEVKHELAPWVYSYYFLQRFSLPRIARALANQIEPLIQQVDVVHNTRIGREGLSYASLYVAREHQVPFIVTPVHHPRWNGWLHRYYHRLYRAADAVIALTEAERQTMIALGVSEQRIFVTGMGPELAQTQDAQSFRIHHRLENVPVILFVGQKFPYKGLAALLEAAEIVWRRFPEAHFVFIGARTTYSQNLLKCHKDPRILDLDSVDLQTKTNAFAACDIFCLPSSQESFGGVYTEAWSFGKPVIGCNISAVRNVIDEGINGFLTPQLASALAEKLLYLLANPDIGQQLGHNGQEKVNQQYTWLRLAEKTEMVYQKVLSGL